MNVRAIITVFAMATGSAVGLSDESRELRSFTPPGSRCAFSTAGGRKPVTVAYQRGQGATEAKGSLFCFDQPHCRCQVRYVDLPDSAQGLSLLEIVNKYGFAAWSEKGKYKKENVVNVGAHEGEEYTVVGLPGGPFKYSHVRVRVFVAAKRAFFISASCPDERKADAEPEIKAFLESFRIVGEEGSTAVEDESKDSQSNTQFLIDALRVADKGRVDERREAHLREVNIQIIGGKKKEPLRSMTAKANRERRKDTAAVGLTDMNGKVALKLSPGVYYIEL